MFKREKTMKQSILTKYIIEVTDTFGGDANYCWVRRYKYEEIGRAHV